MHTKLYLSSDKGLVSFLFYLPISAMSQLKSLHSMCVWFGWVLI